MKKVKYTSEITEQSEKELSSSDKKLLFEARKSAAHAYAPYSNFKVGSAILLENGKIISGNNQENIAYPSGLCAERVTLFSSSANFPNVPILAIAISYLSIQKSDIPITPCGACRQVISEYESKQKNKIRIIMASEKNTIWIANGIENLLPVSFQHSVLKKV